MKRRAKKVLSLLLALTMMIPSVGNTVYATESNEPVVAAVQNVSDEGFLKAGSIPASAETQTAEQPFAKGTAGSNIFRIPCLISLKDENHEGDLVAAADARYTEYRDFGGIDTIAAVSKDNGKTWNYSFPIWFPDSDKSADWEKATTAIDPAIVEGPDGTIYCFADMNPTGITTFDIYPGVGTGYVEINGKERLVLTDTYTKPNDKEGNESTYGNPADASQYEYYVGDFVNGYAKVYLREGLGDQESGYAVDEWYNLYSVVDGAYVADLTQKQVNTDTVIQQNVFYEGSVLHVYSTGYIWCVKSYDGGMSWEDPEILNTQIKRNDGREKALLVSPGQGMVTSDGDIIVGAYDTYNGENASIFYSTDNGASWKRSNDVNVTSSENEIVELPDGTLRMFYRSNTMKMCYADITKDATTGEYTVGTGKTIDSINISSNCNVSAIMLKNTKINGKPVVLATAPEGPGSWNRVKGRIFVFTINSDNSMNLENTFSVTEDVFAYACLTELDNGNIGLLWEPGINEASAICYDVYETKKIIGGALWAKDATGNAVESLELRVDRESELTIGGMLLNDTVTPSITWTATDVADVTLEGRKLRIASKAAGTGVLAVTDGTNTLEIEIEVTTTTYKEEVTLRVGDTVTLTDDKGYYVGTQEVQDASVAGVEVSGTIDYDNLWLSTADDVNYNDHKENIAASHYAFNGLDKTFEISGVAGKGTESETIVYLRHSKGNTIPSGTTWSNVNVLEDTTTTVAGDFKLEDNITDGGRYLAFIYSSATYGKTSGSSGTHDSSFELFTKSDAAPTDSPIPGYVKVESLDGVVSGGKYLIAHKGGRSDDASVYYLLYPSTSSNGWGHAAKVVGSQAQLAVGDNNFTGAMISIDDCLYSFGNINFNVVSEVGGTTVSLKMDGNSGYPNVTGTTMSTIKMVVNGDGTFKLRDMSKQAALHFHKETTGGNALTFNFCGTNSGGTCGVNDNFEIYVKSDKAPADSPIPGYKQVETLGELSAVSQYLIASKGADDKYYVLHPSTSDNNKYTHVAKVTGHQAYVAIPGESLIGDVTQFTGDALDLDQLLYTFTEATDTNGNTGYHIYKADAEGNPLVYVSLRNSDNQGGKKPHQPASAETHSVISLEEKTVNSETYIVLKDTTGYVPGATGDNKYVGAYIHFHSKNYNAKSGKLYFDRCSSVGNADVKNHAVYFYKKAEAGQQSSNEIPGYVKVEKAELQNRGKYLLVFNDEGTLYFMNPPANATDGYHAHVAALDTDDLVGTTKVTIEGKKVGYTEAVVGDTTYQITVQSADINVTVLRGESYTMSGALEGEATNAGIVDLMSASVKAPYTIQNSLTSGEVYLIGRTYTESPAHKCVIMNELTGNSIRMTNNANFESGDYGNYAWRVTAVDGVENGYTLQNLANGKYFTFNGNQIQLKDEAQTVIIREAANGRFYIINSNSTSTYLHDITWLSDHTKAEGYASDGTGSQWNFYQGAAGVQATGKNLGSTTVRVGGVNYIITVVDVVNYQSLEEITAYVNQANLVNDAAYTQTSRNALATVMKEVEAMLDAKDQTEYTDQAALNAKQAEVEKMTDKVTEAIAALQKANQSITLLEGRSEVVQVTADAATRNPDEDIATINVKGADGIYEMTVTGVNSGVTEVVIGEMTYRIYVLESAETTKVLANTGQGTGLPVNRLTISADVAFDLNIKNDEAATFSIAPIYGADGMTNLVAISEDGVITVTYLAAVTSIMETTVTVTVGEDVIVIPVIIRPGATAADQKKIDLHITEIKNTEVYYTWECSTDLVHGYVGETFLVNLDSDQRYALDFMGAPYEGHALTQLIRENETQSAADGHYMLVHTGDHQTLNTSEDGFLKYYDGNKPGAGVTQSEMYGLDTVKKMLYAGVAKGVDGIFGFTRRAGNYGNNIYNLTFRSEKLPTIEKEVAGILPTSGNPSGYRKYTEGMTAAEGEYVYFKINVKSYRPIQLNDENKSNIIYRDMKITDDVLQEASFVTPEFDEYGNLFRVDAEDINPTQIVQQININDDISADVWADQTEETKDHEYYLVYKIKGEDLGKTIENTALLDYQYTSHYSKGVYDVSANAEAEVTVSDFKSKDVVVDFGLPVKVHIETWGTDAASSDKLRTGEGVGKAKYGKVDVAGDRASGWDITYTPTTVLQGVDNVVLTAEDGMTKYSIKVYPANSVYYEGSFMSEVSGEWETKGSLPTGLQQTAELGDAGKGLASNYGYDALYAEELKVPAVKVISDNTVKDIKECLYTFENTGRTYTFEGKTYPVYDISAVNADGTKVYLNTGTGENRCPNQLSSTGVIIKNRENQQMSFITVDIPTEISSSNVAYLHCTYGNQWFDRCSAESNHATEHSFEVYQWTGNPDSESAISGYERVSDASQMKHGEKYLIVFKHPNNDTRYVLHPADGTNADAFTNTYLKENIAIMTGTVTSDTSNTGTALTTTNADASGAFAENLANAEAAFTFTGTGVDLYAHCTKDTGIAMVIITQKNVNGKDKIAKVMMVDTKLLAGSLDAAAGLEKLGTTNNVPFVSLPANSLAYGTYDVAIVHATSKAEQLTGEMNENGEAIKTRVSVPTDLNLDGFRVYGTLNAEDDARYYVSDVESGMLYKDVRDALLAAWNVADAWKSEDGKSVYAEQLAENTLSQIYAATGQQVTGAFLLDATNPKITYTGAELKDYLDNSSKNEVYLYPGQSLVFSLTAGNLNPQIALKSLNGSVQYTMNAVDSGSEAAIVTADSQIMRSNTEMYYPLTMVENNGTPVKTTFTISNTGASGVLAVTKLKSINVDGSFDLAEVTAKDLAYALVAMDIVEGTPTPTPSASPTEEVIPSPTEEVIPSPTETEAPVPTETEEPQPTETEAPEATKSVTEVFDDVYSDWYVSYVQFVYENGLMTGIKGTDRFEPNANITKAQVAQVLYNMEGQPMVTNLRVVYELSDIPEIEWYTRAVAWAYNRGIVTGDTNAKKFFPNADVTREQLALMMYRYAEWKKYDVSATSDFAGLQNAENVSNWAAEGMSWAVGTGLISGVEKDGVKDLDPQGNATRAQMAAILQRFCETVK